MVVLSKRVNPHPNEECDEDPFIFSWDQREKMKKNQVMIIKRNIHRTIGETICALFLSH
jgi:hypothetical protein